MMILNKDSFEGQIKKTEVWNRVPSFRQYKVRTIEIHNGEKVIAKISSLDLFDKFNSVDFSKKLVLKKDYDFKEDYFMIRESRQLFNNELEAKLVINYNQLDNFAWYTIKKEIKTGTQYHEYVQFNGMRFTSSIESYYDDDMTKEYVNRQLDELKDRVNKATDIKEINELVRNIYIKTI